MKIKKSVIFGTIVSAIILVCGIFSVVYFGVSVYFSDLKYFNYKSVQGSITSMSTSSSTENDEVYYSGMYTFEVDGNNYGCTSDYSLNDDDIYVGKTATIKYNPSNPNINFVSNGSSTFSYLYLGISCIIAIIGFKLFDKMMK